MEEHNATDYSIYDFDITENPATTNPNDKMIVALGNEAFADNVYRIDSENFINYLPNTVNVINNDHLPAFSAVNGDLYFYSPTQNRIMNYDFVNTPPNGNYISDWANGAYCFQPNVIFKSIIADRVYAAGGYTNTCNLNATNILPAYSGYLKSAIVKMNEALNGQYQNRGRIDRDETELSFQLNPNPINDIFTIKSNKDCKGKIEIYDTQNNILFESKEKIDINEFSKNIAHLKPGVYYLGILIENGVRYNLPLIKK